MRHLAVIIPESIPSTVNKGVKRVFASLSKLPDDYLVYYEPLINPHRPDIIIISPYLGLLVIQIRNWFPKHIQKASETEIQIVNRIIKTEIHPIFHAQQYLKEIIHKANRFPLCASLLDKISKNNGFKFPTGVLLLLPNCTANQLKHHQQANLYEILGGDKTLCKEKMVEIEKWDMVDLLLFIKSCVFPHGVNIPLTCEQVHSIRAIIHEEIVVDLPGSKVINETMLSVASLKILDSDQERMVHNFSPGHNILYGPANSGKTALMISRCAVLHIRQEDARILVLCYSLPLWNRLHTAFSRFIRVEVFSFRNWAERLGVTRDTTDSGPESDKEFGERCYAQIIQGNSEYHAYNAVFIDEGNMFPSSWIKCAREALKDPDHGDLCIVTDGQKGELGPEGLKWQDIGINIRGHIHHLGITSEKKYQNTREILNLARLFLLPEIDNDEEYKKLVLICECQTRTGLKPLLIWNTSHEHQVEYVVYLVQRILSSIKSVQYLSQVKPDEIAILYPYAEGSDKNLISSMIPQLGKICPVQWVSEESTTYDRVNLPGLKVHDCHSIQGLFYRVVMILFAGKFERFFTDSDYYSSRNLFYMALTRPLDFLTIQYTDRTEIIRKILASGYADEFIGK